MEMSIQDKAYNDYIKKMKYADIAKKYGVSVNTVKSWQRRHGWTRKKGAPKNKKGAPFHNKNAVGNKGGGGPGNQNATKHGLYAKYLPEETLSIVMDTKAASPLDILWSNIQLKYASIIHAQKIMYVRDAADDTVMVQSTSVSMDGKTGRKTGVSKSNYIKIAADKEATFLSSQSRAMQTLTNMIRQYEEMLHTEQADEEQQARIAKLKAETRTLSITEDAKKPDINPYVEALKGEMKDIWSKDDDTTSSDV